MGESVSVLFFSELKSVFWKFEKVKTFTYVYVHILFPLKSEYSCLNGCICVGGWEGTAPMALCT